jgi:glycosyltransferase involved in cell wall biosynthesis
MKEPLVSLILLSYNYEAYVGDAIRSVLAQTYPHWELIVIDDASTDRSLEVIRSFSDPRIRLLRRKRNVGPSASYNQAYASCRGQYVGSLDADDFLAPRKLELQVGHFETHPDLDVLGTFVTEVDAAGHAADNGTAAWFNQELDLNQIENWLMRNHLCHSSVLLRRSTHDRLGLLNPHLRVAADYELWLRGLAQGARFEVLKEPLLFSRQHGSNAWRKIGRIDLFLELAHLFSAYLAPHLAGRGQVEQINACVSFFNSHFLAAATDEERSVLTRQLLNFSQYPRDFAGFVAAFERGCGRHWPAILDAIDPGRDRTPASWRDSAQSWLEKLTMPWRRRHRLGEEDDSLAQVEVL